MLHKHVKSLPHHPKRVIILSLLIAGAISTLGYIQINQKVATPMVEENTNTSMATQSSSNLTLGFLASGRIKSVSVKAGDTVSKGQVLAELDAGNTLGALTQARAAYANAKANLTIVSEQTSTSKNNVTNVTTQQDTLVANARRKLYSDNLIAISEDDTRRNIVPTISGNYDGEQEGQYKLYFANINALSNNAHIHFIGLEKGTANKNDVPEVFGSKGLLIAFPNLSYNAQDRWTVDIANKNGTNYVTNLNAYQAALETRNKAIADAKASVGTTGGVSVSDAQIAQAQAGVSSALGAVQIAEAAYNNTIIKAPADGTVTSVAISVGQIAVPNAIAIGFISHQ